MTRILRKYFGALLQLIKSFGRIAMLVEFMILYIISNFASVPQYFLLKGNDLLPNFFTSV